MLDATYLCQVDMQLIYVAIQLIYVDIQLIYICGHVQLVLQFF